MGEGVVLLFVAACKELSSADNFKIFHSSQLTFDELYFIFGTEVMKRMDDVTTEQ